MPQCFFLNLQNGHNKGIYHVGLTELLGPKIVGLCCRCGAAADLWPEENVLKPLLSSNDPGDPGQITLLL